MDGVTLGMMPTVQNESTLASAATAKTPEAGQSFADMLAAQISDTATEEPTASTPETADAAAYAMDTTIYEPSTSMASILTAGGGSDNLLYMLMLLMSSNQSGNNGTASSLLSGLFSGADGTGSNLSVLNVVAGLMRSSMDGSSGATGSAIVQQAMTRLGDPYSKSKRGQGDYVDCSYLVKWAYAQQGIELPPTAASQAKYCFENGYTISKEDLQPGDLVFWTNKTRDTGRWNEIHHVAIYAGNNKIVEAKPSGGGVVVDDMWGESGSTWEIAMYARPYR